MRRALIWCLCACLAPAGARASSLTVATEGLEIRDGVALVECAVTWRNAWRNDRNHDGVWVFVKTRNPDEARGAHAAIAREPTVLEVLAGPAPSFELAADRTGFFLSPGAAHRGDVSWRLRIAIDAHDVEPAAAATVYGVEMVYIPESAFTLGDPGELAPEFSAFQRMGASGEPEGLYRVTSERPIPVGQSEGDLHYPSPDDVAHYRGDQQGPIPAEFPKGFGAFWVMKYELSQGQYAAMLNDLNDTATAYRAVHGQRGYSDHRGSIDLIDGVFVAAAPDRPLNFGGWDDGCAFADWAALRPMTELEFEKACRGPVEPLPREYPWGTTSKDRLVRVFDGDDLVTSGEGDESLLTDDAREVFGASHYWVMDLAGSAWERCVTIGHPTGRGFRGTHGDGSLRWYGDATNDDWPRGDDDGGGYGYRGGGYYRSAPAAPSDNPRDFNPHSPTGWRPYGAWGGGPRSVGYGFRAGRTAE